MPLTPEEAPADGEPVVPCAQGRIVVETARPAQPHFATCSTYRKHIVHLNGSVPAGEVNLFADKGKGAISKKTISQSQATRPEVLGVMPWYFDDCPVDVPPGLGEQSSYPSNLNSVREIIKKELAPTKTSSLENDQSRPSSTLPRKACMDLRDAIALLDETCPNAEASPSLTPRTPRTPLTPYPRNKRARSKSSDNSSNFSNERLNERSLDNTKSQEKEKRRPFLRKIGISRTEDRPFLSKLTPKIIGKPYLEKIGPSRAVEKPFLAQIGSFKTVDKFTFDTPKIECKKQQGVQVIPTCLEKQEGLAKSRGETKSFPERRRSRKAYLSKMYSFEIEDLDEAAALKNCRDSLRGVSMNNVLETGPCNLPHMESPCSKNNTKLKSISTSEVEFVKCRVTTSEEIISSNICLSSPAENTCWEYSPRRKHWAKRIASTPKLLIRRRQEGLDSKEGTRSDNSTPNSPTKRTISSVSPERQIFKQADVTFIRNLEFSPSKTKRQGSEDIQDKKNNTHVQIEKWGISSDNLNMSRETVATYTPSSSSLGAQTTSSVGNKTQENLKASENLGSGTFKELHNIFELKGLAAESYSAFKQRTRGNFTTSITLRKGIAKENSISLSYDVSDILKSDKLKAESSEKSKNLEMLKACNEHSKVLAEDNTKPQVRRCTVRSVLRKQEGVDQPNDQESDNNASFKCLKGRIPHEPSQETMDLLTELRKVKSLLRTPSIEKDNELGKLKDVTKQPKKVLLTDKEFCLSIERENSIRRPSKANTMEVTDEQFLDAMKEVQEVATEKRKPGLALFEKRCMSLDFVDDERPQKPEVRAISLASGRSPPLEIEEPLDFSKIALNFYSKSSSSAVFNTPEELESKSNDMCALEIEDKPQLYHYLEVDIANTLDQNGSPKKKLQLQSRTSDAYEIISPRATPFRIKKRLGRISVEDTMQQESFTLKKTDCKSVILQKNTKCFPL